MKPIVCAAALAVLGAGLRAAPAPAADVPPPPTARAAGATIPDTPAGRAARALLDAVGAPDGAAVQRFAANSLARDLDRVGPREWTAERYAVMLGKLREQSGGLEPVRVLADPNDPRLLRILCLSRTGDRRVGVELAEHPKEAGKLSRIELHVMTGPGRPEPWPDAADEAAVAAAIDRRARAAADADRFSGVVLVAKGDRILLNQGYGLADRARQVANTADTAFGTCSVGKMFTGVAVAQLVEREKLRFEDTLADVLPEYPNRDAARKVTVHHLLTHTSGVGDPFASPRRDPAKSYPAAWDNIRLFAGQPLAFEPGARHEYSNGNYAVLAAVVEKVSGRPFGEYVRDHIYTPAGMAAADPAAAGKRTRAVGYTFPPDTDPLGLGVRQPAGDPNAGGPGGELAGFGGVELTAEDLFRFFRALRENLLLGREMTEAVTTGKVAVGPGAPMKYGYGFYDLRIGGVSVRGHSGGGGNCGLGAHAELVWENGYAVIVLGNYDLENVRPLALDVVQFVARRKD